MEQIYRFNPKAVYKPHGEYKGKVTQQDLCQFPIVVADDGQKSLSFDIKLRDSFLDDRVYYYEAFDKYREPGKSYYTSIGDRNYWHHKMKLWDTQLNFAIYCATSGLGVSVQHLNAKQPMVQSFYKFHTYYHIRRVLQRIQAPLPDDHEFNRVNNAYSLEQFKRVAAEYGVPDIVDVYRNEHYLRYHWNTWLGDKSEGFTKQALEKISESVRAYAYLILTSQVGARHIIVGNNAEAMVAQRLFQENIEDVITKPVDLRADVGRYQLVLKYARSKLDYSVGEKLYMLPSNMVLKPLDKVIDNYNDKIVISDSFKLGKQMPLKNEIYAKDSLNEVVKKPPHLHQDHTKTEAIDISGFQVEHTYRDHLEEKEAIVFSISVIILGVAWYIL